MGPRVVPTDAEFPAGKEGDQETKRSGWPWRKRNENGMRHSRRGGSSRKKARGRTEAKRKHLLPRAIYAMTTAGSVAPLAYSHIL